MPVHLDEAFPEQVVEAVEEEAGGQVWFSLGEDRARVNGHLSCQVFDPPGDDHLVGVDRGSVSREKGEVAVLVARWEGLISVQDVAPAALVADRLGGRFALTQRLSLRASGLD